jgi:hypothetical protein
MGDDMVAPAVTFDGCWTKASLLAPAALTVTLGLPLVRVVELPPEPA